MSDAETVRVDLGDRSYDIVIGDGVLARAGALIADARAATRTTHAAVRNRMMRPPVVDKI